jgi:hypothetical protein
MKRADLKIGMDVLVTHDRDWQDRMYGSKQVQVVDLGDWHIRSGYGYGREAPTIELDGETYTLNVNVMRSTAIWRGTRPVNAFIGREHRGGILAPPKAYRLIHAKGPWAESRATQERNEKAWKEGQRRTEEERSQRAAKSAELLDRMLHLGINMLHLGANSTGQASVPLDKLEKLIELAEANR